MRSCRFSFSLLMRVSISKFFSCFFSSYVPLLALCLSTPELAKLRVDGPTAPLLTLDSYGLLRSWSIFLSLSISSCLRDSRACNFTFFSSLSSGKLSSLLTFKGIALLRLFSFTSDLRGDVCLRVVGCLLRLGAGTTAGVSDSLAVSFVNTEVVFCAMFSLALVKNYERDILEGGLAFFLSS